VPKDPSSLSADVGSVLFPDDARSFDPVGSWQDLGRLLETLEARGMYLMTNSVADPGVRRMASFHKMTPQGYPCVGSSEWGRYPSLGDAVLRAAHEALLHPRAT
jgi:hypothetical protein